MSHAEDDVSYLHNTELVNMLSTDRSPVLDVLRESSRSGSSHDVLHRTSNEI